MTVVWVLLAWTGHTVVPTLEFKDQATCERAVVQIKKQVRDQSWNNFRDAMCVKVEK